jgi:hypothetical protein
LKSLLRALFGDQFSQHQLLGQAAEGDVIHGDTGRGLLLIYSLVKHRCLTSAQR